MKKTCPKCKTIFECKADEIENCLCNSIQLNTITIERIKNNFKDCLCVECLKQVNANTTNEV